MAELADVLEKIGEEFKDNIWTKSNIYCVVDIGKSYAHFGLEGDADKYKDVKAFVPLKKATGSFNVQVDGTEFSDCYQLESGVFVEEWVAEESGLQNTPYQPKNKMILSM